MTTHPDSDRDVKKQTAPLNGGLGPGFYILEDKSPLTHPASATTQAIPKDAGIVYNIEGEKQIYINNTNNIHQIAVVKNQVIDIYIELQDDYGKKYLSKQATLTKAAIRLLAREIAENL